MRTLAAWGCVVASFVYVGCASERPVSAVAEPELQVAATLAFTEGPAVDTEGNVFFTETVSRRIMKLSPAGSLTVFRENSNLANGLAFDLEGRLIACEGDENKARITRTDMKTGAIETLADRYQGKRFRSPNDVTVDGKGRIYFTDQNRGSASPDKVDTCGVYRIDSDRKITRILQSTDIQVPNGVMISPDDRTLDLVESNGAENGARMIRAYDLQPDGTVRDMRVFHNFYPGRSADGLCIDTRGNLYAAAGLHRRRGTSETLDTKPGIHVFSPEGKLTRFLPAPEDTITNCAFGGPDMKTLYVTDGKSLLKYGNDVAGTRR